MNILVRQQSAPYLHAHDGLLQTEAAAQFVLAGKNPYVETYYQTPLALAPFDVKGLTVNPALEHFTYLPLTFLLPAALAGRAWQQLRSALRAFDLLPAHALVATRLTQNPQKRLLLVMALGLNPLFVGPLVEGRNDVMVLSWLIFTWALLQRGKITASAITLALACGTKHPAVVFVPFYFVYSKPAGNLARACAACAKTVLDLGGLDGLDHHAVALDESRRLPRRHRQLSQWHLGGELPDQRFQLWNVAGVAGSAAVEHGAVSFRGAADRARAAGGLLAAAAAVARTESARGHRGLRHPAVHLAVFLAHLQRQLPGR